MAITLSSLGETTRNYSFTAGSLEEAVQQMQRLGPRDGDGHHSASCDIQAAISLQNLQISTVPGSAIETPNVPEEMRWSATAAITQATLEYRVIFLFPQWTNVGTLSRPVQNEWRRYTGCLRTHERGHVRVAMPVLRQYVRQYERLRIGGAGRTRQAAEETAQRDCRSQITSVFSLFAHDTQQAGDRYDRRTRHGRTQGAQLRTRAARGSRH
jgi:predicted secreted Zn-dependent protease